MGGHTGTMLNKQFIGVTGDPEVEKESARSLRAKRLRWPLTLDSLL